MWSVGVGVYIVRLYMSSVPPSPPSGYMLEVDSKKRPHAACTHV